MGHMENMISLWSLGCVESLEFMGSWEYGNMGDGVLSVCVCVCLLDLVAKGCNELKLSACLDSGHTGFGSDSL